MPTKRELNRLEREQAWIGDAVLSLLARQWVLEHRGRVEAELFGDLTSNRFLSTLGSPTAVEAHLGRECTSKAGCRRRPPGSRGR